MKNKIISLESGENYYILEEMNYLGKKYVLGAKCDLEKDNISSNEFDLFVVDIKNNDVVINNVYDEELAKKVTENILEKIRNS